MDELHKIQLEEAIYRKEAARLQMLQEELKLQKLQNENSTNYCVLIAKCIREKLDFVYAK